MIAVIAWPTLYIEKKFGSIKTKSFKQYNPLEIDKHNDICLWASYAFSLFPDIAKIALYVFHENPKCE